MRIATLIGRSTSKVLVALVLVFSSLYLQAQNLQDFFNDPKKVGEARLSVYFWDIYDASLFASNGTFAEGKPFALELKYLRKFKGKEIASRSVDEMRKLGMHDEIKLAKWYQAMQEIFPNVKSGETITGIVDEQQISHFYFNKKSLGSVHDKEFSQWFFNIWLSDRTSEPEMREQLLGKTE